MGEDFYGVVAALLGEDPVTSNIGRIALQMGEFRVKVEESRSLRDYLREEDIVPDLIPLIKLKIAADGLGFSLAIHSALFDPCDNVGRIRDEIKLRDNFTFEMYFGDELFDDDSAPICKYAPKVFQKDSSTVLIRRLRPPPYFPQPRRVLSPSAETWKPKVQQSHPFPGASYKSFDPQTIASSYFLGISGVVPRPIALTSTVSETGQRNCSPFSYFNIIAHDPPTVVIGICRNANGSKKDTLQNIEATKQFVVNIISDWFVEAANHTCGAFAPDVDEIDVSGLTAIPSEVVTPCRIGESAFQMECIMSNSHEIVNDAGNVTTTCVFGRVVRFHVLEPLVAEGPRGLPVVKFEGYRPLGRIGGDDWVVCSDYFEIKRPAAL